MPQRNLQGSRVAAVQLWLKDHPGQHRPVDVATGLGLTTHQAATTLTWLLRDGRVVRHEVEGYGSRYSLAPGNTVPITPKRDKPKRERTADGRD